MRMTHYTFHSVISRKKNNTTQCKGKYICCDDMTRCTRECDVFSGMFRVVSVSAVGTRLCDIKDVLHSDFHANVFFLYLAGVVSPPPTE